MLCELCNQEPSEHFAVTHFGERHVCARCFESLALAHDDDGDE